MGDSFDTGTASASDPERDMLLEYLHTHEAVCPLCGYDLRQLTSDICPECGQRLELRVGAVGVRIGALCAALAPLLMMAGVGVLFLAMMIRFGPPGRGDLWAWVPLVLGLIDGFLSLRLYSRRTWFFRLQRKSQNRIVLASWLVNLVLVIGTIAIGS